MPTEVIYVYVECSNMSGHRCYRDTDNRDDVQQLDVTVAEYKRLRRMARKAGSGRDLYLRRCAREVLLALRQYVTVVTTYGPIPLDGGNENQMATCKVRMQIGTEAFLYTITLKPFDNSGQRVLTSSAELMVHGQRQDETSVKWHYFPIANLVTYAVESD